MDTLQEANKALALYRVALRLYWKAEKECASEYVLGVLKRICDRRHKEYLDALRTLDS